MQKIYSRIIGFVKYGAFKRNARAIIDKIDALERIYSRNLPDSELPKKTEEFKKRAKNGETLESLLPEAFALVKSAARRLRGKTFSVCEIPQTWEMVHYDVQLMGGIALCKNSIAEIATGEGKTLTATLPAYLHALSGKGCHIATVNEYLARRDCEWMGNLYSLLGLSSDFIYAGQSQNEKKRAYACDITYGTASEFGFDYLRDNSTTFFKNEKVQRGFNYCLVDEADSILIDEARTPLIISGEDEDEKEENPYERIVPKLNKLAKEQRRLCNEMANEVADSLRVSEKISEENLEKLWVIKSGMPRNKLFKDLMKNGMLGKKFSEFEVRMKSNFTRAYALKEKLFFTLDEKLKHSDLTERGRKILSGNEPYAFYLPDLKKEIGKIDANHNLSSYEKAEKKKLIVENFALASENIHALSQLLQAYLLYEKDVDYIVEDNKVKIIDPNTGRAMEGRRWSNGLHQAVEAKEGVELEKENKTFAEISLQNYFRMYKHLSGMTGTAESDASEFFDIYGLRVLEIPTHKECIREELLDLFYLTRREKYAAVCEKITHAHKEGQPVLVGTSSVEDSEILSKMLKMQNIPHNVLNAKNHAKEARIIANAGKKSQVTIATNMAGRGTDIKLGNNVEKLGGLFVIGTNRHESRRIDRQLIGRCARQGDKGKSIFMISAEDELLRLNADMSFMAPLVKKRHKNGYAFQHAIFKRIVERAQRKVEGENFSARKYLLKFDDVSNKQRDIAYKFRDSLLEAETPLNLAFGLIVAEIMSFIKNFSEIEILKNDAKLQNELSQKLLLNFSIYLSEEDILTILNSENAEDFLKNQMSAKIVALLPDEKSAQKIARIAMIQTLDSVWRDHLTKMDDLKNSIYLRSYGQRDPVEEYKKEAFLSFEETLSNMNKGLSKEIFKMAEKEKTMGEIFRKISTTLEKRSAKLH